MSDHESTSCGDHSDLEPHGTVEGPVGQVLAKITGVAASRRAFIKGVIASGATLGASGYMFRSTAASAKEAGALERLISLKVNGQVRRVDVLPYETLAQTVRYKLGLTGTKLGCDRGECGACTVLLNDIPHYSCTTLTHMVGDRAVTTIEGLAQQNGDLHPVQKAFIAELGPQCGYCTPGQIMSAVGLLKVNPKPNVDEVRRAMSGNLCRCGSYEHYLNSVMRASKEA